MSNYKTDIVRTVYVWKCNWCGAEHPTHFAARVCFDSHPEAEAEAFNRLVWLVEAVEETVPEPSGKLATALRLAKNHMERCGNPVAPGSAEDLARV